MDLVKTRLQQSSVASSSTSMTSLAKQSSMFSVVRHVLRTEHVSGLWRGIVPSITRTVPGVGLYFSSLHWLKSCVYGDSQRQQQPHPLEAVCLGMAARCVAGAAMIPVTVVKTRYESDAYHYQRMTQAFSQIYAREGVRGLCCGLAPTLMRDAPFSGLYLMFYTQLKSRVIPAVSNREAATSAANFSCGVAAGFMASLVTHPADVVKTRMQLNPHEFSSVRVAVLKVYARHGAQGFLVGLVPRMLRRTLMSALAWTVYEEIMRQVGLK